MQMTAESCIADSTTKTTENFTDATQIALSNTNNKFSLILYVI